MEHRISENAAERYLKPDVPDRWSTIGSRFLAGNSCSFVAMALGHFARAGSPEHTVTAQGHTMQRYPNAAETLRLILVGMVAIVCLPSFQIAYAVTLQPGDIIIGANIGASTTNFDWGLLEIDPATGNRTIIADSTHGSGPAMQVPTAISFAPDGSLLVTYDNYYRGNDRGFIVSIRQPEIGRSSVAKLPVPALFDVHQSRPIRQYDLDVGRTDCQRRPHDREPHPCCGHGPRNWPRR